MSEFDVVKGSRKPYTKQILIADLKKLGLKSGDNILVHSSLSKLGWVVGGEQTVLFALLEVIGNEGTIVMPSFSGDNSDPIHWQHPSVPNKWFETIRENMQPFYPIYSSTRNMGRIVDLFRHYDGVVRSYHPQVSFCALGPLTHDLLDNHQLSPGFGENSPLQRMYNNNFKVVLLGVGYSNCTCMHLGEVYSNHKKWIQTGARIIENGESVWKKFQEIDYDDSDFEIIGKDYEKSTNVCIGCVGQGQARILDMKSITDYAYKWMNTNRVK